MKNQEVEKIMTISKFRESGLTGAGLTGDQIKSMRDEIFRKNGSRRRSGKRSRRTQRQIHQEAQFDRDQPRPQTVPPALGLW